jgi:hypothetical protein
MIFVKRAPVKVEWKRTAVTAIHAPTIFAMPPAGNVITPSTPPLAAIAMHAPRVIFVLEVCANLASLHSTVTTSSHAQMTFVMPPLAAITSTTMPTIAVTVMLAPLRIIV